MSAKLRIKCPHCGEAFNAHTVADACPKCRQATNIPADQGKLYIYRQGSFYGVAGAFGLYLNSTPCGFIGNKELLCFPLPYGTYNIHCAVGMSRKCRDMVVTLSPENPVAYTKVYIKPGFWTNSFVVEPVDPSLLEL